MADTTTSVPSGPSLGLGPVLMIPWNLTSPQYFRSQPEDIEPRVLVDQAQEYRLVVDASGIPYNPEALPAESREEPVDPDESPRA